ncbi:MAG: glycosyltransferase [Candidatus Rokubacteria bacterium]|nr:glycosyltransferase [Candidatus Rokubacteria bacterium]
MADALAAADADVIVFLDGDRNEDPRELPVVLAPLLAGQADLVIGSRTRGGAEPGALTPQQRVGLARWGSRSASGSPTNATSSVRTATGPIRLWSG